MSLLQHASRQFENAPLNPPDSIFGLNEEFKQDTRNPKINLSVGVYQDELGRVPMMASVKMAEKMLLEAGGGKNYLPINGLPAYNQMVGELVLGEITASKEDVYWSTLQTPGGTGALRIAGETLRRALHCGVIWISNPTWANHSQIFHAAGLTIRHYEYLDSSQTRLDFEQLIDSLASAEAGQAILLHAVCHNPTGVDPSPSQWQELIQLVRQKELIPIFDFAYQGFGENLVSDSLPIQLAIEAGCEILICNSFSKNFGLYAERVGGVTVVAGSDSGCRSMASQLALTIRTIYSNPPLHGGSIVATVLGDAALRRQWEAELTEIRQRIASLRTVFVSQLSQLTPAMNFDHILQQRGMFSYSGLTSEQVQRLKQEYAIYALSSGRINVAGINQSNLEYLCQAIAAVTK